MSVASLSGTGSAERERKPKIANDTPPAGDQS
jgi:hypothetical protein